MGEVESITQLSIKVLRDGFYENMQLLHGLKREEVIEILEGEIDISKFEADRIPEYESIINTHKKRQKLEKRVLMLGRFPHRNCPVPGCEGHIIEVRQHYRKFDCCSEDTAHMVIYRVCKIRAKQEEKYEGADPETRQQRIEKYIEEYQMFKAEQMV